MCLTYNDAIDTAGLHTLYIDRNIFPVRFLTTFFQMKIISSQNYYHLGQALLRRNYDNRKLLKLSVSVQMVLKHVYRALRADTLKIVRT